MALKDINKLLRRSRLMVSSFVASKYALQMQAKYSRCTNRTRIFSCSKRKPSTDISRASLLPCNEKKARAEYVVDNEPIEMTCSIQ